MQLYTASLRKARRFCIALTNLTGHRPALFRFPGGGWAVQEEILSATAGRAIGRLLAAGVRCDRITGPLVLMELVTAGTAHSALPIGRLPLNRNGQTVPGTRHLGPGGRREGDACR